MNPRLSCLFVLGAALGVSTAMAADKPDISPQRLSNIVRTLSSDDFQGRGPATDGETKTVAYLIGQLQALGLTPAGDPLADGRAWTQNVPLLRAEISGAPSLSVDVNGKAMALTQGEEIAVRAAMNGDSRVDIASAPLVFVGYGVNAPERDWNDFKGVDLHGKVAVVLVNDPDFETGEGDFGGNAMTYYGRWTYKFEEAARQGAAGILVVHETKPASYGWATVKNSNTNAMFDVVREQPELTHVPMEGWIQRDLAVDLFASAGLDFEAAKRQAQTRAFAPMVLKGVTLSASYAVETEVITSHTVAAEVKGSAHPDEYVIYSAHWDHLGVGQPDDRGDTIYNGAVDNATGTASLLELARAFVAQPAERSVLFLFLAAEEKGLLGSEFYASSPLYPLGRTVAVINTDALNPGDPARNFSTSGSARQDLLDRLIATGKAFGLAYSTDPHPEAGYFFRSDHFSFAKRGVPAVSFKSGDDLVDGGTAAGEQATVDYRAKRYHQPADEWQADWSFAGMARDLSMLYTLGRELANSRDWPNWDPQSEFRAARDSSAADRVGD